MRIPNAAVPKTSKIMRMPGRLQRAADSVTDVGEKHDREPESDERRIRDVHPERVHDCVAGDDRKAALQDRCLVSGRLEVRRQTEMPGSLMRSASTSVYRWASQ